MTESEILKAIKGHEIAIEDWELEIRKEEAIRKKKPKLYDPEAIPYYKSKIKVLEGFISKLKKKL